MPTIMIFLEDHTRDDAARPPVRLCGGTDAQRVWARFHPLEGVDLLVEQQRPAPLDSTTKSELDRMFTACAVKIFMPATQSNDPDT